MPNSPTVSVLILNFNGRTQRETCLPTVDAQVYPKERVRIEVIDNGSTDGSAEAAAIPRVSGRAVYQLERGAAITALDGRTEPFPTWAAAALSGIHDFLLSLPTLTERRAVLQARRRRSDADILSRFGLPWLSPCGATHQLEHNELNRAVIDSLGVAELVRTWTSTHS